MFVHASASPPVGRAVGRFRFLQPGSATPLGTGTGCSLTAMTSPDPRWAILDGRLVPHRAATVHVSDLGLRRGFAVFEIFRVEEGVPLFLGAHLARLGRSADAVGLPLHRGADGWPPTSGRSSMPTDPTSARCRSS
jgi:hypothetical protein